MKQQEAKPYFNAFTFHENISYTLFTLLHDKKAGDQLNSWSHT